MSIEEVAPLTVAVAAAAVGSAAAGGAFGVFSTVVMTALGRLPDADGLRAMQAINRAAPHPLFMLAIVGTALLCLPLLVIGVGVGVRDGAPLLVAGAALGLAGAVVTVAYHVPRNEALGRLDADAPGSADAWRRYRTGWTRLNHVRTLTALTGAALLAVAAVTG